MSGADDTDGRLTLIERFLRSNRGTEIWRGRDERGASVVIKLLANPDELEGRRLLAEGRLLASLGGRRHLARCLRIQREPPALVLEPAGDQNLLQKIHRGAKPLPIDQAVPILLQAADALDWLHQNGIVHRDVKCSNLVLGADSLVTLIDLGVAAGAGLDRDWIDESIGTLGYCAPELLRDATLAEPTLDVYGLAATLYETVSGQLPYDFGPNETEAELRERIAGGEPAVPLRARRPVPPALGDAVDRGLAAHRADRFPTVAALARALEPFAPRR